MCKKTGSIQYLVTFSSDQLQSRREHTYMPAAANPPPVSDLIITFWSNIQFATITVWT